MVFLFVCMGKSLGKFLFFCVSGTTSTYTWSTILQAMLEWAIDLSKMQFIFRNILTFTSFPLAIPSNVKEKTEKRMFKMKSSN